MITEFRWLDAMGVSPKGEGWNKRYKQTENSWYLSILFGVYGGIISLYLFRTGKRLLNDWILKMKTLNVSDSMLAFALPRMIRTTVNRYC